MCLCGVVIEVANLGQFEAGRSDVREPARWKARPPDVPLFPLASATTPTTFLPDQDLPS